MEKKLYICNQNLICIINQSKIIKYGKDSDTPYWGKLWRHRRDSDYGR